MDINEIIYQLGEDRKNYYNAVSPPIIQTSNFAFDSIEDFRSAFQDELRNHLYTRGNNPTVEILRKKLAALEKTEDALVLGSGAAAMTAAVLANVSSGDHILCVAKPYSWTHKLLTLFLNRFNIDHTFVDGTDTDNFAAALKPNSKLLILESPNSVTFELQNLVECAAFCKKHNLISIIDNSYASPLYQNPHILGIDIIVHTITKYINGHSDVVAGCICSTEEQIRKIFAFEFLGIGACISAYDAAMIIRGLRTLPTRMERITKSTLQILDFLKSHSKVRKILYPFDESFDQYKLAKKQMKSGSGLFSIILNTENKNDVYAFVNALDRFLIAVSWGGHESLIMPFISFHDVPNQEDTEIPFNLIRFSIGLEDPEFLIEDLNKALNAF